jgi:hypothetical protein
MLHQVAHLLLDHTEIIIGGPELASLLFPRLDTMLDCHFAPGAVLSCGVANGAEELQAITLARDLPASWDAFEFIVQSARAYHDPDTNDRGYAFMPATVAACRGRNALACAPSLPDDDTGDDSDVCLLGNETQAAAALADLAAALRRWLAQSCGGPAGHDDRQACEAAIAVAIETHALLAIEGGR